MKKIIFIFILLFSTNVFAEYSWSKRNLQLYYKDFAGPILDYCIPYLWERSITNFSDWTSNMMSTSNYVAVGREWYAKNNENGDIYRFRWEQQFITVSSNGINKTLIDTRAIKYKYFYKGNYYSDY